MRICYIGHPFHERTDSTRFILELLQSIGTVTVRHSSPDAPRQSDDPLVLEFLEGNYDLWVFAQTEYVAARLVPLGLRNAVIVPMYDGARDLPDAFWRQFVNSRFLCFSRAMHEKLQRLDQRSIYAQYYPSFRQVPSRAQDRQSWSGFFWERRPGGAINIGRVAKQCRAIGIGALHVHAAPDFAHEGRGRDALRSRGVLADVSITQSTWFDERAKFLQIMSTPHFHFVPRLYEGIGMTMLEAMASGQVVVAPDTATANEYIGHMASGILYDPDRPLDLPQLSHKTVEMLSKGAWTKVKSGRETWLRDRERVISYLQDDGRRWPASDSAAHFILSLQRSVRRRRVSNSSP
ncbi:MAG: glycosyltransferase [Pseudomonadota bacterium]